MNTQKQVKMGKAGENLLRRMSKFGAIFCGVATIVLLAAFILHAIADVNIGLQFRGENSSLASGVLAASTVAAAIGSWLSWAFNTDLNEQELDL